MDYRIEGHGSVFIIGQLLEDCWPMDGFG